MSKISLIIEREYLTRVQKKSFILMTILSPIVMVALIFAPIWLAQLSSDEVRQIAIIDQTGLYKNIYENSKNTSSPIRREYSTRRKCEPKNPNPMLMLSSKIIC